MYHNVRCDIFYHYFTDLNTARWNTTAQVAAGAAVLGLWQRNLWSQRLKDKQVEWLAAGFNGWAELQLLGLMTREESDGHLALRWAAAGDAKAKEWGAAGAAAARREGGFMTQARASITKKLTNN